MSYDHHKRFRVTFTQHVTREIEVSAGDEQSAIDAAESIWIEKGPEAFATSECDTSDWQAEVGGGRPATNGNWQVPDHRQSG